MTLARQMGRLDALIFATLNHGRDTWHYLREPQAPPCRQDHHYGRTGGIHKIGTKLEQVSDMADITFCIQKMYEISEKKPKS